MAESGGAGSRVVDVPPERLSRWVANFVERHGPVSWSAMGDTLRFTAADGVVADVDPPFPPLPDGWAAASPVERIVEHALAPRVFGVLLVRLGGYAAGVFDGETLVTSKVGSRPVHGRAAAGGWSQHRFARRREGQARVALGAAADAAALVLLPARTRLQTVVTGGDRAALRTVLADARLVTLTPLIAQRVLDVPDPRARILRASAQACRAVRVTITEPG